MQHASRIFSVAQHTSTRFILLLVEALPLLQDKSTAPSVRSCIDLTNIRGRRSNAAFLAI